MGYSLNVQLAKAGGLSESERTIAKQWAAETTKGLSEGAEDINFFDKLIDGKFWAAFKPSLDEFDMDCDIEHVVAAAPDLEKRLPGVHVVVSDDYDGDHFTGSVPAP